MKLCRVELARVCLEKAAPVGSEPDMRLFDRALRHARCLGDQVDQVEAQRERLHQGAVLGEVRRECRDIVQFVRA